MHWYPLGQGTVALHCTTWHPPLVQICPAAQAVPAAPQPATHTPFAPQTCPIGQTLVPVPQVLLAWQVPVALQA